MKDIIELGNVYISNASSVVGQKEADGPIADCFDHLIYDEYFGKDTFEKAESEMCRLCINTLLAKSGLGAGSVNVMCAGDLVNQCVATSYAAKHFSIPYLGLYGACSTAAESLLIASSMISGGIIKNAVCYASSHFCTAERQYRFPLEYGCQRPPTSQNTVTGCGAFLLTDERTDIAVHSAVIGRISDNGIADQNNMGAAMATAAYDTIKRYHTSYGIEGIDLIATGDLGAEGFNICRDLLLNDSIDVRSKMLDCGLMIYDRQKQDVHAGGSGCGCMAVVAAGKLLPMLKKGEINSLMLVGTGALLNTNSVLQGSSIPSIAHAVVLKRV